MQAHDAYVLLAIGNDPWPIGVTSVGIHDRTGREKISAGKIARASASARGPLWATVALTSARARRRHER